MGIFQRISDILSANLHDMLEKHEHPERLLKQAVAEMEDAIGIARREVAKAMASESVAAKDLAANQAQAELWSRRAAMAVESGVDHLGRKALVRKREYEQIVESLTRQIADSAAANSRLREQLEGMQAKLAEARRQLGALTVRQRAAALRVRIAAQTARCDIELDRHAFEKFDRLSRKVQLAEAEAVAFEELAHGDRDNSGEWGEALSVDDELKRLKEQQGS